MSVNPEISSPPTDHRRAVAERNVEAILDAAERLLEQSAAAQVLRATIACPVLEAAAMTFTTIARKGD